MDWLPDWRRSEEKGEGIGFKDTGRSSKAFLPTGATLGFFPSLTVPSTSLRMTPPLTSHTYKEDIKFDKTELKREAVVK